MLVHALRESIMLFIEMYPEDAAIKQAFDVFLYVSELLRKSGFTVFDETTLQLKPEPIMEVAAS